MKIKPPGAVATMIIRVGQEEYMNYEATGVIMYGKLGETGNAHPLY